MAKPRLAAPVAAPPLVSARQARRLYRDLYSDDERAQLGEALTASDLSAEVELLRVLIQRGVAMGASIDVLTSAVQRLAGVLKVQHVLTGDSARSLDEALARVLAEVGAELGI